MDHNRRFPLILSGFWLKIIALLTMTIDHIGLSFNIEPMRYIGRLALPLFCFMIAEGAIHTKSFKKYALRLGIMASFISIAILLSETIPFFKNNGLSMRDAGIIFVDLLLGALAIYLLKQKQWYFKVLAILPVAFGVTSAIVTAADSCRCYGEILWFPYFIRTQYGWYAIVLTIGFYFAHLLCSGFISYLSSNSGVDRELYKGSNIERNALNMISVMVLAAITMANYLSDYFLKTYFNLPDGLIRIQLFAIASGAFILLYSGLRGYNKKWFQYGSYLYYPLHMAVIALIQIII